MEAQRRESRTACAWRAKAKRPTGFLDPSRGRTPPTPSMTDTPAGRVPSRPAASSPCASLPPRHGFRDMRTSCHHEDSEGGRTRLLPPKTGFHDDETSERQGRECKASEPSRETPLASPRPRGLRFQLHATTFSVPGLHAIIHRQHCAENLLSRFDYLY